MKRIVIASLGSLLLGTVLLTAGPGYVPSRDYTGIITDSMCGADHAKMQLTPESKCVQECVRSGAKYALLLGQNIYILSDQKSPSKFAAQRVTVDANLDKNKSVLTVLSIHKAK
jgi:hypothetical protein